MPSTNLTSSSTTSFRHGTSSKSVSWMQYPGVETPRASVTAFATGPDGLCAQNGMWCASQIPAIFFISVMPPAWDESGCR